ncbi:hypothetical protein GmHk_19G054645 [Glycine max]|nr:hypothetical protein GmHk_19G054645 [Glycine max]
MERLVDLAAIDSFLAFHHSKESPVVTILANIYDTFDRRCERSGASIVCCTLALYVWLVSHLLCQEGRHVCPLQGHHSCAKKGKNRDSILMQRISKCSLDGNKVCINYNPVLAIRQLGYPMRGAPSEENLTPFITRGFNDPSVRDALQRKDKELRGSNNGIIGGYRLDWVPKLRAVREEEAKAPEESKEVQAIKVELEKTQAVKEKFKSTTIKRAWKEEHDRNKFRGALWGSNSELKLRRDERDQSRVEGLILKDELKACIRSKRSLSQQLSETEGNMLAIIDKYREELNLATAHEHRLVDEYAKVSVEKEARGRVIDSLHREAIMWMDRFTSTLNGSQELPRLLARAKAMTNVYSTPEEIHGLLNYCQHMIDLMAHIIRSQEAQEQMKADMSALKDQMAFMMEAMLGMKRLIESNAATTAAASTAAEVDSVLPSTANLAHQLAPDMVGRGRDTLGNTNNPYLGYNRIAYPYGLPPKFTPLAMHENTDHAVPFTFEGQPPQPAGGAHEEPRERAQGDIDSYPPFTTKGSVSQPRPMQPLLFSIGGPPLTYQYNTDMAPDRTKLQNMTKLEHKSFKEYAQRWRDLVTQVAPPMVEREMITMIVDTLSVFYYEKLVGYMPSSFADLVFVGERIEVGLKRGKFDYLPCRHKQ